MRGNRHASAGEHVSGGLRVGRRPTDDAAGHRVEVSSPAASGAGPPAGTSAPGARCSCWMAISRRRYSCRVQLADRHDVGDIARRAIRAEGLRWAFHRRELLPLQRIESVVVLVFVGEPAAVLNLDRRQPTAGRRSTASVAVRRDTSSGHAGLAHRPDRLAHQSGCRPLRFDPILSGGRSQAARSRRIRPVAAAATTQPFENGGASRWRGSAVPGVGRWRSGAPAPGAGTMCLSSSGRSQAPAAPTPSRAQDADRLVLEPLCVGRGQHHVAQPLGHPGRFLVGDRNHHQSLDLVEQTE